ncbi:hypothetical protein P9112_003247 [Eukaryota sp. TZLM1-RC]
MIVKPFSAYRPPQDVAGDVCGPPYDVLNSAEARVLAEGNPRSILHVNKPEIDLAEDIDLYSDQVYEMGRSNLHKFISEGWLVKDDSPGFYIYSQQDGDHVQYGLCALTSVHEYENGKIRIHEHTRAAKQRDRERMVNTQNANVGPVFLTYEQNDTIDSIVAQVIKKDPTTQCPGPDNTFHKVWVVSDAELITRIVEEFSNVNAFYIADGHHRAASAFRVGKERYEAAVAAGETVSGDEPFNFFLSVVFPSTQLKIVDYNRVVKDLNGLNPDEFKEKLSKVFEFTEESNEPIRPSKLHEYSLLLDNKWYRCVLKDSIVSRLSPDDPVANLDTQILTNEVLSPILNIQDLRTCNRIDFVGGTRGLEGLEKRCKEDCVAAFALYPVSIEELMAVADASMLMPPKSTWFVPKLASGLVVRMIE